jgi:hypothetical protein
MLNEVDQAYFNRRARESRALAASARDQSVARIHESMASQYEARARMLIAAASEQSLETRF